MRHIGTLIAAIIIAPLAWILLAYGQDRSAQAFTNAHVNGAYHNGDFVRPLQFLAAAGLLLGLLATLRFSPLGAMLTGAGYVGSYALLLVDPDGLLRLFGDDLAIAGHHANPTTPIRTGTTLLLGTLMLVGMVSIGRWRRRPRRADGALEMDPPERPVGVDGLGLTPPDRQTEPEFAARYTTRSRPARPERAW